MAIKKPGVFKNHLFTKNITVNIYIEQSSWNFHRFQSFTKINVHSDVFSIVGIFLKNCRVFLFTLYFVILRCPIVCHHQTSYSLSSSDIIMIISFVIIRHYIVCHYQTLYHSTWPPIPILLSSLVCHHRPSPVCHHPPVMLKQWMALLWNNFIR